MAESKDKVTTTQIVYTMGLLSISMLALFSFQTVQVMQERATIKENLAKLDSPMEQSQKLNSQFGGLVVGVQKLAGEGNPIAKDFVGRLKKVGIIMEPKVDPAPVTPPPGMVPANMKSMAAPQGMVPAGMPANLKPMAPVPAAQAAPASGPVKP